LAKNKQVKLKGSIPPLTKQPRIEQPSIQFNKLRPAWRFGKMEMCDPFGWHVIDKDKLAEIRTKLAGLENSTWNDILVASKKQNHFIAVADLEPEAQRRLRDLRMDDIDQVLSLRLSGEERVFGIRYDVAISLLWWDPKHQVCKSVLKHT
jgi:hypothetical protein